MTSMIATCAVEKKNIDVSIFSRFSVVIITIFLISATS